MIVKEKVWNIFRHNIETNNMEYITIKEIIDLLVINCKNVLKKF